MDNKAFDEIIKKHVEGAQAAYNAEHWDMMSSRLDQEFGVDTTTEADAAFDQNIKASLEGMTIPATSDSWDLLQDKIAEDAALRRKVIFVKAAELVILLLIVFTIFNLNLLDPILNYNNEVKQASSTSIDVKMRTEASQIIQTNRENSTPHGDKIELEEAIIAPMKVQKATPNEGKAPEETTTEKLIFASVPNASNNNAFRVIDATASRITTSIENTIAQTTISGDITESTNRQIEAANMDVTATVDGVTADTRSIENITTLASLNSAIEYKQAQRTGDILLFDKNSLNTAIVVEQDKNNRLWLNTFASADLNLINSPFDFVYSTPSYLVDDLGSSAGVTISKELGKWELETGIVYSDKSYQPRINEEILGDFRNGYQKTSLNKITFNMLSVPLNLKLKLKSTNNWSLYMMAGAALNVVTNSHFEIGEESLGGSSVSGADLAFAARLSQKTFEPGLFEGGDIASNLYLSTNIGLGVQRSLGNRVSLYLQPNYSYHTLGATVGPNNDKIHSLSLQLGAKIALN